MASRRCRVMPGRRNTRCSCKKAGHETTTTASHRPWPPVSNSSGMSSTTRSVPRRAWRLRKSCSAWRTRGWRMASSRFSAARSPNTRRPSSARSTAQSLATPGNSASTAATALPPGPNRRCTVASASCTGTPRRRSIAAAVDLPMPMEPVRPKTFIYLCLIQERTCAILPSLRAAPRTRPRSPARPGTAACQDHRRWHCRAPAPEPANRSSTAHRRCR